MTRERDETQSVDLSWPFASLLLMLGAAWMEMNPFAPFAPSVVFVLTSVGLAWLLGRLATGTLGEPPRRRALLWTMGAAALAGAVWLLSQPVRKRALQGDPSGELVLRFLELAALETVACFPAFAWMVHRAARASEIRVGTLPAGPTWRAVWVIPVTVAGCVACGSWRDPTTAFAFAVPLVVFLLLDVSAWARARVLRERVADAPVEERALQAGDEPLDAGVGGHDTCAQVVRTSSYREAVTEPVVLRGDFAAASRALGWIVLVDVGCAAGWGAVWAARFVGREQAW